MSKRYALERKERIERMLSELRYEVERGMLDGEIEEILDYEFIVPVSKTFPAGVVVCRFTARPSLHSPYDCREPKLKVVS